MLLHVQVCHQAVESRAVWLLLPYSKALEFRFWSAIPDEQTGLKKAVFLYITQVCDYLCIVLVLTKHTLLTHHT